MSTVRPSGTCEFDEKQAFELLNKIYRAAQNYPRYGAQLDRIENQLKEINEKLDKITASGPRSEHT